MEFLARSVKYVNGENKERVLPQAGNSSIGMKMPLMKTSGNLIIEEIIITPAGVSVGGYDDISMLKDAKQNVARTIPKPRTSRLTISIPISRPVIIGNTDTKAPKMKEEKTSPRKIAHREIGAEMSRSRVFALASHGTMAGPTEVAVKKAVIPSNPGIRALAGKFLPM